MPASRWGDRYYSALGLTSATRIEAGDSDLKDEGLNIAARLERRFASHAHPTSQLIVNDGPEARETAVYPNYRENNVKKD